MVRWKLSLKHNIDNGKKQVKTKTEHVVGLFYLAMIKKTKEGKFEVEYELKIQSVVWLVTALPKTTLPAHCVPYSMSGAVSISEKKKKKKTNCTIASES